MLSKEKIDRINFLAKKSKKTKLTEQEQFEQQALRQEYIHAFRNDFKKTLDAIEIVDEKQ